MSDPRIRCAGVTASGRPCQNWRLNSEGLCWRHDGRPATTRRARVADTRPRTCRACGHLRPARAFNVGPTNRKTRVAYRKNTCRDCEERERRAAGIPKRHVRRDGRGNVWCNNCETYRHPANFKPHPCRPHTFWAYCKDCTREMDRIRSRVRARTPEGKAAERARTKLRSQRRKAAHVERRRFVQEAITLLRRRGLTKADICRLAQVAIQSVLHWERGERQVTPNAAARFGVLLLETAHLPIAAEPAYRRRHPHPELPRLITRVSPQLAALPLRTRWKGVIA